VAFAAIAAAGALANRLGQSVIPFYIISGMLLGEFVLGRVTLPVLGEAFITESVFLSLGAELGIVLLLFFLGLEFNLTRLLARRQAITRAGTIDLGINFGVGLVLGWLVFGEPVPAVLVAGIVYISSSAVITKSLIDLGWIANDEAEPLLGTLVYEDLFIAVYLAVVSAVVLGGGGFAAAAADVGVAVGFMVRGSSAGSSKQRTTSSSSSARSASSSRSPVSRSHWASARRSPRSSSAWRSPRPSTRPHSRSCSSRCETPSPGSSSSGSASSRTRCCSGACLD